MSEYKYYLMYGIDYTIEEIKEINQFREILLKEIGLPLGKDYSLE